MSKPTKLIVTTPVGTFTRTTLRTYSHLVVVRAARREVLDAERRAHVTAWTKELRRYEAILAGGPEALVRERAGYFLPDLTVAQVQEWVDGLRADLAKIAAPITTDGDDPAGVLGWCGRLDLAQKLAASHQAARYREVRIFSLDGQEVRG